jgi:hypothetical protein
MLNTTCRNLSCNLKVKVSPGQMRTLQLHPRCPSITLRAHLFPSHLHRAEPSPNNRSTSINSSSCISTLPPQCNRTRPFRCPHPRFRMMVVVIQGAFSSIPQLQCRMKSTRHPTRLLHLQSNAKSPARKLQRKSLLPWKTLRQPPFPTSRSRINLPSFFPPPKFLLLQNDLRSDWLQLLPVDVVSPRVPPESSQRILRQRLKRQHFENQRRSPTVHQFVAVSPNVSRML